ncbi:hypothetical protein BD309DRAFT_1024197 [Dichomitus squalens]|uniref:Uncharacterized protein n=1 Tax=Dichomitus squalens TaxID=114155 RepID=A0A4Q9NAY7_9APHY|nr:hypothetical protein BD309DRAFT_1024197 [Dichomitus squalens]TBU53434.1 hypothetical protein BD310DRAFT_981108 [Dichomitus squalens]
MASRTAWDLYAKQLWPLCYGHPLWIPEPSIQGRETLIGDVGWLKNGGFRPLSHSMKPAEHPLNAAKKVPSGFRMFGPEHISIDEKYEIHQLRLSSHGVRNLEASSDIQGGTSWALQLEDHEIIFVCSTIKTTQWVIAAFQDDAFRDVESHIAGSFATFATVGLSIQLQNQTLATDYYRFGPRSLNPNPVVPMITYPGSSTRPAGDTTPHNDQCLFINYYKMKRRRLWKAPFRMRAGAGPHELPPNSAHPGTGSPSVLVTDNQGHGSDLEEASEQGASLQSACDYAT